MHRTLSDALDEELYAAALALSGRRIVALTGAGISTESGIPDYRGDKTRERTRNPMRFDAFAGSPAARKRYWARATAGWPCVRDAAPNAAHDALAFLGARRFLCGVITQNVDGLHHKAGSDVVVELHGALRQVSCLACGDVTPREDLHVALLACNPTFRVRSAAMAPDGDTDLLDEEVERFAVVACARCSGDLKPRVVFFGENVPPDVLASAWRVFDGGNALLVVGTSLEVFSGRRFVEEAARRGWPIVLVNRGPTRSDALATVRLDAAAGAVVPALASALSGGAGSRRR